MGGGPHDKGSGNHVLAQQREIDDRLRRRSDGIVDGFAIPSDPGLPVPDFLLRLPP